METLRPDPICFVSEMTVLKEGRVWDMLSEARGVIQAMGGGDPLPPVVEGAEGTVLGQLADGCIRGAQGGAKRRAHPDSPLR